MNWFVNTALPKGSNVNMNTKVRFVSLFGTLRSEYLDGALRYAEMAWDVMGAKIVIHDMYGNEIKYHFNSLNSAVLDNPQYSWEP